MASLRKDLIENAITLRERANIVADVPDHPAELEALEAEARLGPDEYAVFAMSKAAKVRRERRLVFGRCP